MTSEQAQTIVDAYGQQWIPGVQPEPSLEHRPHRKVTVFPATPEAFERFAYILVAKYLSIGLGASTRQIGALLHKSPGTIARWLKSPVEVGVNFDRKSLPSELCGGCFNFHVDTRPRRQRLSERKAEDTP